MTQEEKFLIIRDVCARLPYGVIVEITSDGGMVEASYDMRLDAGLLADLLHGEDDFKPYLRPMSSMTKEEIKYKLSKFFKVINTNIEGIGYIPTLNSDSAIEYVNWLIENHFDYHGLIPMGLALEAKEGMYKF